MHSIVPHEHHGELSEQEEVILHSANECIFDWLQLVFHDDLGAGHLEHFVPGESPALSKISGTTSVLPVFSLDPNLLELKLSVPNMDKDKSNEFNTSLYSRHPEALRGPPTPA